MKTRIESISKVGYGHFKITIQYSNGKYYSTITTDTMCIDAFRSDEFTLKQKREVRQAYKELINKVKRANNLR
jgi:hypothetical protein